MEAKLDIFRCYKTVSTFNETTKTYSLQSTAIQIQFDTRHDITITVQEYILKYFKW